jgi:hypothetical protein
MDRRRPCSGMRGGTRKLLYRLLIIGSKGCTGSVPASDGMVWERRSNAIGLRLEWSYLEGTSSRIGLLIAPEHGSKRVDIDQRRKHDRPVMMVGSRPTSGD